MNIGQSVHRKTTGGSSLFVNRRPLPLVSSQPGSLFLSLPSDLTEFSANTRFARASEPDSDDTMSDVKMARCESDAGQFSYFWLALFNATGGRRWYVRATERRNTRTHTHIERNTQIHTILPS